MLDSVRNCLMLATGAAAGPRERAVSAARHIVVQGESTAGQMQALAEELVSQSKSNREAIIALVRYEVDRALGRVGVASSDEVAALRARVRTLEAHLRAAEARIAAVTGDGLAAKATARTPARSTAGAP